MLENKKKQDGHRSLTDESYVTATFDLQSVLAVPCSNVSTLYYTRKLAVYNLTVYEKKKEATGICNVWEEINGRRGSCDVGTCIYNYLTKLPVNIKHVTLYSDNCTGQNHNQYVLTALYQALSDSQSLETVEHKFLTTGHTEMEVDSMHSTIEYAKRHVKIHIPDDWHNIFRMARRNNPYHVIALQHADFIDFKAINKELNFTFKVDTLGKQVKWQRICYLQLRKEDRNRLYFKYNFYEAFSIVKFTKTTRRSKSKTIDVQDYKLYDALVPISKQKKDDLLKLCHQGIIPELYHSWYNNLPVDNIMDRLAEPDAEESDIDSD